MTNSLTPKFILGTVAMQLMVALLFCPLSWAANVRMNVVAANATSEDKKDMVVRQDLPPEIRKEDILETGGLQVGFDEEKSIYYVHTKINLGPKETKSFAIVLKDVWLIPDAELGFLKDQTASRLSSLEGKSSFTAGKALHDNVVTTLDQIGSKQTEFQTNIEKRIDLYRVSTQRMNDIRQKVSVLDDFVKEAEREDNYQNDPKSIKFVIQTSNSSSEEAKGVKINRYLPEGIRPDHIVDPQGFEIKFDKEKNAFYLETKTDFKPNESKAFTVLIRDMWHIPEAKLDGYDEEANRYAIKLVDTRYKEISAYLMSSIRKDIETIKDLQAKAKTPEDKIAIFHTNEERVETIRKNIDQLKRMSDELESEKKKSIKEIVKSVTPDVAATWKLIYATIVFLTLISSFFFFLWWGQAKGRQGKKLETLEKAQEKP